MSFVFIERESDAEELASELASGAPFALDCEAAGFHRYSDRLCLVQVTTGSGRDFILDALAFDVGGVLKGPLEDPSVPVLMHGADYDLRLLDRDVGIRLQGLVDTQVAASLLGERALGLAALLEKFLDVRLAKKFQRADWARRPLPDEMLDYAAKDTRFLHELVGRLQAELTTAGRIDWAREEYRKLEEVRWEGDSEEDPVVRVKAARDMTPRGVALLRAALAWRDEVAKKRDKAIFRIASDQVLIDVVTDRPRSVGALANTKGMNGRLAEEEGAALLERLEAVDAIAEADLEGYPPRVRTGPGRPPPEVEELADRLKSVRNSRAESLGIDRGTLLPNAALLEIARVGPRSAEELSSVAGLRQWQLEVVGPGLLKILAS
ncbi:HRDC domain-containing protein [Gaopeijia maritima]|uniref:ribonuclease D n=1 Tax=Gaopeijia maritima TaxID=3119007 RepID=UPI00324C5953